MKRSYEVIKDILNEVEGVYYTSFKDQVAERGELFAVDNVLIHKTGTYLLFDYKEEGVDASYNEMLRNSYYMRNKLGIEGNVIGLLNTPTGSILIFMESRAKRVETRSVYEMLTDLMNTMPTIHSEDSMNEIKNTIIKNKEEFFYVPDDAIVATRLGTRILVEDVETSNEKFNDSLYFGPIGGYYWGVSGILNKINMVLSALTFGFFGVFILQAFAILFCLDKNAETGKYYKPSNMFRKVIMIVIVSVIYFFALTKIGLPIMAWVLTQLGNLIKVLIT